MIQEEKDLLLKDLCARLPYGVKIQNTISKDVYNLFEMMYCLPVALATNFRPYLRPMSSMTEEEKRQEDNTVMMFLQDFYNSRHLDYRGLIEKGLALEAPKGMYKL